jgi:hypothetical protein
MEWLIFYTKVNKAEINYFYCTNIFPRQLFPTSNLIHLSTKAPTKTSNLIHLILYPICTFFHLSGLFTVHCSLFTVHCSLFTIHYSLFTIHYSLFTIHYSLFTIHYSLFTIHYSLFTVHRSQSFS